MNLNRLLMSCLPPLLLAGAVGADEPKPRPVKIKPPVTQSVPPVSTPMPAATSASALDKAALNPQPLPPKVGDGTAGANGALNPQPLPPKVWGGTAGANGALNPQPLPPKVGPDPGILKPAAGQASTSVPTAHAPSKGDNKHHERVCATSPCP